MPQTHSPSHGRVDWVDYAKGFCIIFVVMMHSTLGVGEAVGREGFMHAVVEFARPFRMPDFFLISGLFLARVIDRDWRTFADRKILHFVYFYLLWVLIQFVFKAPGIAAKDGVGAVGLLYLETFIEPFGTLWFIYLLPVFFAVTKLSRRVPPLAIWLAAAALEIAHIHTGWTLIDEFAARFVYFYTGYILAAYIFQLAALAQKYPLGAIGALLLWGVFNGIVVFGGASKLPLVSLGLGLAGAAAVVALSALLAKVDWLAPLRYCGRNSIVIYLAFFLPMAATRTALVKTGIIDDVGVMAVLITTAGVIVPLILHWAVRGTRFKFLFERPDRFHLVPRRVAVLQPAA